MPLPARYVQRIEERYNLADALAVATYLNVFVRQCSERGRLRVDLRPAHGQVRAGAQGPNAPPGS